MYVAALPADDRRRMEKPVKFAKYSPTLTKEAGFKDRRSKIGIRPDGTLRYDLSGIDKGDLREKVFERDGWACVELPDTGVNNCSGPLELSHWPPMSKSGGSDEMKSCFTRCRKHHRLLDNNQVQLRNHDQK